MAKYWLFLLVFCLSPPMPVSAAAQGAEQGLIRDTVILVRAAEQRVWSVDHYEIEELLPQSLLNVCQASLERRQAALLALQKRIELLGGDAKTAWIESGKRLGEIDALLTQTRAYELLKRTIAEAQERCPFYLEPHQPYRERHRAVRRGFVGVEGGGLLNVRVGDDDGRAGGGGAGRFIYGYGLSPEWSARFGIESGGAGFLNQQLRTEDIDVDMYFGAPVVLRHRSEFWHQDIELAGVALGVPWRDEMRYAGRLAGLVGVTYPRLGQVQPWFGLRFGVEYCPEQSGESDFVTIRLGFRVGLDLHFDGPKN